MTWWDRSIWNWISTPSQSAIHVRDLMNNTQQCPILSLWVADNSDLHRRLPIIIWKRYFRNTNVQWPDNLHTQTYSQRKRSTIKIIYVTDSIGWHVPGVPQINESVLLDVSASIRRVFGGGVEELEHALIRENIKKFATTATATQQQHHHAIELDVLSFSPKRTKRSALTNFDK